MFTYEETSKTMSVDFNELSPYLSKGDSSYGFVICHVERVFCEFVLPSELQVVANGGIRYEFCNADSLYKYNL